MTELHTAASRLNIPLLIGRCLPPEEISAGHQSVEPGSFPTRSRRRRFLEGNVPAADERS